MELKDIREKVNKMLMETNNIDKLITDKVNDYILIEEQPLPIKVGDRTIFVGNLTLDNNYKFWTGYGNLMANIGVQFINFDMISDAGEIYQALMKYRILHKGFCKLIAKTLLKQQAYYLNDKKQREEIGWKNCSYRYFKKNITMEKLIQIMYLIYFYNFDAVKKNLKIMLTRMVKEPEEKQAMETYMYFWLQNLPGLTGKFQLPRLASVDWWQNEDEYEVVNPIKKMEGKRVTKFTGAKDNGKQIH